MFDVTGTLSMTDLPLLQAYHTMDIFLLDLLKMLLHVMLIRMDITLREGSDGIAMVSQL